MGFYLFIYLFIFEKEPVFFFKCSVLNKGLREILVPGLTNNILYSLMEAFNETITVFHVYCFTGQTITTPFKLLTELVYLCRSMITIS